MERKVSPDLFGCLLCTQGYGAESHVWIKQIFRLSQLSSLTLQGIGVQTEGGFWEDPFLLCAFQFRREIPTFLCLSTGVNELGEAFVVQCV